MASKKVGSLSAMAFYHADGLVPAFKQASEFAGTDGRIATMPDIVTARLATKPGDVPWRMYFTTLTAEYLGYSKGGVRILIVAHGVGPMATLDGILKTYKFHFNDKARNRSGGRISKEEFRKLEEGHYGEVSIIKFDPLLLSDQYFFYRQLRASRALQNPLLRARLGQDWERYILWHAEHARQYHVEQGHGKVVDPFIIQCDDASNCTYGFCDPRTGALTTPQLDRYDLPLAHLLSTGSLMNLSHQDSQVPCMCNEVSAHEWWNSVRFLAIQDGGSLDSVHPGLDIHGAIRRHWKSLMIPVSEPPLPDGFYPLTRIDAGTLFTQYPKIGAMMDTHEPEFMVTSAERIHGGPETFKTAVGGYHGFFKYDIKEVRALAPQGANAYYLPGEVQIMWKGGNPTHHVTPIEFYRVEINTGRRLIRASDLANDYDLLMKIVEAEQTA